MKFCENCSKIIANKDQIRGIEWYFSQDDDNPMIKPIQVFCWNCFKQPETFQTFSAYLLTIEYGFCDRHFRKLFHKITKIPENELQFKYCM